jgi:drug/metabolite transporter (DMT)-like permease
VTQSIKERWTFWTLLEALARTATLTLQRFVGELMSPIFTNIVVATAIIGFIQAAIAWFILCFRGKSLLDDRRLIIGSCLFGILAFWGVTSMFMAFTLGGDISVVAFIATLSIVPGAFIDFYFFGSIFTLKKYIAIILAIISGYSVLGWPSLEEILNLPPWVWFALGAMVCIGINQGITRAIKQIDPLKKNFWAGLSQFILGSGFFMFGIVFLPQSPPSETLRILTFLFMTALVNVLLFYCSIFSYRYGGSIALKKILMNGSFLGMSASVGIIFLGEPINASKIIGAILFVLALMIWDYNA